MTKTVKAERLWNNENISPNFFSVDDSDIDNDDGKLADSVEHLTSNKSQQQPIVVPPINVPLIVEPQTSEQTIFEPNSFSYDDFDPFEETPTDQTHGNNKCGVLDNFFSIIETNGNNVCETCNLCDGKKMRGSKRATSNFIRHM